MASLSLAGTANTFHLSPVWDDRNFVTTLQNFYFLRTAECRPGPDVAHLPFIRIVHLILVQAALD
jgi:hypothetical protein